MSRPGFARFSLLTRVVSGLGLTMLALSVIAGYRATGAAAGAVLAARRTEVVLDQTREIQRILALSAPSLADRSELDQRVRTADELTPEGSAQRAKADALRALAERHKRRPAPGDAAAMGTLAAELGVECERGLEAHVGRQAARLRRSMAWQLGVAGLSLVSLAFAFLSLLAEIRRRAQAERALSRSNEDLERFAAVAAHDLQAPLGKVILYLDLLKRRTQGRLDEQGQHCVDGASRVAGRMVALIQSLLAFSQVSYEGQARRPVGLDGVLDTALSNLAPELEEAGARVDRAPLPTLSVDPNQTTRLFQNLVGNALKFRRPHSAPLIKVSAQPSAEEWIISVADDGVGVDPARAGELFGLFKRLHDKAEYPGHGLGLAICKRIIERHGGRIWVEPTPGGGTTFRFALPRG